jgi:hypothetical protein
LREGKEREREREKRRNTLGTFFLGPTHPAGCAAPEFSRLLGAIKSSFKGHPLNFMCT